MIDDPSKWVETADRWDAEEHYIERGLNGFSMADWINFDTYIAWVIANAVEKMKNEGNTMFSFPDEPVDDWERLTHEAYDVMIKGFGDWVENKFEFGTHEEQLEAVENLDRALDVFKKHFKSLWD